VLYSGVSCITDLMVKEGLINLDFADVRAVMRGMGKAMMGTGEASGEDRARHAAEAAIANPLLDDVSMQGARGLLISITGGPDLTLYEVDEAASRIREEVDEDANIILGATFDSNMTGTIRVSVVATGTDAAMVQALEPMKAQPGRAPLAVRRHAGAEPQQPAHKAEPQVVQVQAAPQRELEVQVASAVAEAISHRQHAPAYTEDDEVVVEPYVPAAAHEGYDEQPRHAEQPVPSVYVPSSAERPDGGRRMPRTEEFPALARRAIDAQERQEAEPRNARALFRKLASNVGLNLRSGDAGGQDEAGYSSTADAAARSAIEAGAPRAPAASAPREGAAGHFDAHGRPVAQATPREHIEIPSFLRKHG
jgi:cell division protein FtsZ